MATKSEPLEAQRSPLARVLGRSWHFLLMLASIALVLAISVSSATRERAESIADFSSRQALLAKAISIDFENGLTRIGDGAGPPGDARVLELLGGARRLEQPGDLMVLVARPHAEGFLSTDNRIIPSKRLRTALDAGEESVQIPRDESVGFGLPRRMAIAGVARVTVPNGGTWGLVVVSSARRLRDRQLVEERRLAGTVVVVAVVAIAFGVLARRREKLELEREREAALARADKMAALAALSTGIAHEVGTPLGVIVGRVEQALERTSDERAKAALGVVLEQVDRIRRIVRGCLALARGDAPHLVPTPPASLAEHATDLVRHRFANAGIELACEVGPDLPAVACEPALFEQALVNVLLNACEATPRGGNVRLSVETRENEVRFVVEDDGKGISDETARRATEPFFSTRREEGGSGLGLTIAREIVSHHAGSLTVENRKEHRGTRATISVHA